MGREGGGLASETPPEQGQAAPPGRAQLTRRLGHTGRNSALPHVAMQRGYCIGTPTESRLPAVGIWVVFPQMKGSQRLIPHLETFFQLSGIPDLSKTTAWTSGATTFSVTPSVGPAPTPKSSAVTNPGPPYPPWHSEPFVRLAQEMAQHRGADA